tara:strand:+ start:827 stop:1141 length:315 start_codon:yes stop_codon:yes gene_type:complete
MNLPPSDYTILEIDNNIRENIRKTRIFHGLEAKEVAKRAGISIGTYSNFENIITGPTNIGLNKFLSILSVFGLMDKMLDNFKPEPRTHKQAIFLEKRKRIKNKR